MSGGAPAGVWGQVDAGGTSAQPGTRVRDMRTRSRWYRRRITRFACGSGATSRPALALAALLAATGGCAHDPPPLPAEAAWAATPEGDRYLALVRRELHAKYVVPQRVRDRGARLKAALLLFIEPDGRVATWRFEARSGDAEFDAALDEAVQRVRLPPPPEAGRENLRSKGLGVVFRLQPP